MDGETPRVEKARTFVTRKWKTTPKALQFAKATPKSTPKAPPVTQQASSTPALDTVTGKDTRVRTVTRARLIIGLCALFVVRNYSRVLRDSAMVVADDMRCVLLEVHREGDFCALRSNTVHRSSPCLCLCVWVIDLPADVIEEDPEALLLRQAQAMCRASPHMSTSS